MLPKFIAVRQKKESEKLSDVCGATREAVESCGYALEDLAGKRVGITAGSRGIDHMPEIIRTIAAVVKAHGGEPIVFAAMGSHGGGTAEGQREVLASLGITEEYTGAEIRTCGACLSLGKGELGWEVYANQLVREFDRIILVNRIKPHTDFSDITESGLLKLMAIGIGNTQGADTVHTNAIHFGYGPAIRDAAAVMLRELPIVFGVAITENWRHETNGVTAVLPSNTASEEARVLQKVKDGMVKLPVEEIDTLIIQEAGKNISGTSMDTKVIGRIGIHGQKEPESPRIKTITVLTLTEESHGNAIGLGLADVVPISLFQQIDPYATFLNGITSSCTTQAKLPCAVEGEDQAIQVAISLSGQTDSSKQRIVFIKNTNMLEHLVVSQAIYEEIRKRPDIETVSDFFDFTFDDAGMLSACLRF